MSTLFSFPTKKQLNAQGAVTENPGRLNIVCSAASVLSLSFVMWSSIVPLFVDSNSNVCICFLVVHYQFPSLNLGSYFFVSVLPVRFLG